MARVFIGTSGFSYSHWQGVFYPQDLPQKEWLRYYRKHFDTVEINATFYHQMKPETFKNWRETVGPNFVFSIKASRFITHIKKLKGCKEPLEKLMVGISVLRTDLYEVGPRSAGSNLRKRKNVVLFQLPPRWQTNPERLKDFVELLSNQELRSYSSSDPPAGGESRSDSSRQARTITECKDFRFAFEFRDQSWLCEGIYKVLRNANCALVIQDSPYWPKEEVITADFTYLRFHGSKRLYSSNYSDKELKVWAKKIKKWLRNGLDVYVYFNNDAMGYAVENAKTLIELVKKLVKKPKVST